MRSTSINFTLPKNKRIKISFKNDNSKKYLLEAIPKFYTNANKKYYKHKFIPLFCNDLKFDSRPQHMSKLLFNLSEQDCSINTSTHSVTGYVKICKL